MCIKNQKILVVKQLILRLNVDYMQVTFYPFRPKNKISMLKKLRSFTCGPLTRIAFVLLAIFWFSSTLIAYLAIRRKDIRRHELAMIFSYSMCFAAVTLRLWNPMLLNLTGDFLLSYRLSAWLCWVPNLIFAIPYTHRMRIQRDNQMPNNLFTLC